MHPLPILNLARALPLMLSVALAPPALAQGPGPAGAGPVAADAIEQRVWRGAPIRVDLRLDSERTLRLAGARQLRAGLLGGPVPGLRVQSLGDHLYLEAQQPFAATRVLVQSDTGQSILLDLAAAPDFPAGAPLEILADPAPDSAIDAPPAKAAATTGERPVGYVALVRHAAQSLYAPGRLAPWSSAITRTPLPETPLTHLVRGAQVQAEPVAAWHAQGPHGPLWVAAVRLRNTLAEPVVLDPRDLRGQWRAASFQHARLGRAGDPTDTTTLYLVADRRIGEALGAFAVAPTTSERVEPAP